MANEPPGASRDLRELLQTLPQELYSNVYDEVFTAVPNKVVIQRYSYKWPHLLHVDRASREAYAKSYFGLSTFICSGAFEIRWIRTLCDHHVNFIKELFYLCISSEDDTPLWRFFVAQEIRDMLRMRCREKADKMQIISCSEAKKRFGI
ncbi:hypothetical protein CBER1_01821 [Cercospora berteroae]|uniref:F-box domain-containing protein n=1 Tax=Cercospora berteroae TaxID=357750 RepID=A0A2S6CA66_9PEZI|nr:hypothetical protein CBER1_01821 [Cercospora berteroae]